MLKLKLKKPVPATDNDFNDDNILERMQFKEDPSYVAFVSIYKEYKAHRVNMNINFDASLAIDFFYKGIKYAQSENQKSGSIKNQELPKLRIKCK